MTHDARDPSDASTAGKPASDAAALQALAAKVAGTDPSSSSDDAHTFPGVLNTDTDSPVLLGELLGGAGDRFEFVRINGVPVDTPQAASLPGVRVGHGDGSGFVFRRALDGELVFAPDREFLGTTTFGCTVVNRQGTEATLIARVIVNPDLVPDAAVAFTDGSTRATLKEGSDGAILGALGVTGAETSEALTFRVYEAGASTPSDRFLVSGGRLCAFKPLDPGQGDAISLRVVAYDGALEVASGNIEITTRQIDVPQSANATFVGEDDFFRFLEGVADQHWSSFGENGENETSGDAPEARDTASLVDWLVPLDEFGAGETPDVPIPPVSGPFGE